MSDKSKVLGVIPARLGSSRVPGKMLIDINGKTLIERTVERTKQATALDALVVATDSEEIKAVVEKLGVPVIMTDPELPTGSDRAASAVAQFTDFEPDIVAIIWGDEPLYPAVAIDDCVQLLFDDEELQVASVGDLIETREMWARESVVKVLTDKFGNVLYISRAPVPHVYDETAVVDVHHIIGVMCVRTPFLKTFLEMPRPPMERREGVEQMRILENGYRMRVSKGQYGSLGVNTPEELEQVREIYRKMEGS